MPNGDEVNFPDDMPKEQIKGLIASKFPELDKQPSIMGGMQEAYQNRTNQMQDLANQATSGQISQPEAIVRGALKVPQLLVSDLPVELAKGAFRAIPDFIENPIRRNVSDAASRLADIPAYDMAGNKTNMGDLAGSIPQAISNFQQSNPIAAGRIGSALDVVNIAAPFAPIGKGQSTASAIGSAVDPVLKKAGSAIASPITAPIKGSSNLIQGVKARSAEELQKAGMALGRQSSQTYKAFRDAGAQIKPETINSILKNIDSDLVSTGKLNQSLHGKTLSVLEDFKTEAQSGNLSLEGLDQYRQLLGDVIRSDTDIAGRMGADAFKAKTAIKTIDDSVISLGADDIIGDKNAVNLLTQARKEWSQNRKFGDIARIVERAGGDANKLKRDLSSFLSNPKKTGSFTKDELESLKKAANQTTGEGLLKMVGKFGFDIGSGRSVGNTALPIIGGLGAGAASGGVGALVPVAGTAARQAQKWVARGKVENLLNLIEQGGKVSTKQIMDLPAKDAKALLKIPEVKEAMKKGN